MALRGRVPACVGRALYLGRRLGVPPVTPIGMVKATRGMDIQSVEELDERQIADWMKQVVAVPGVGKKT